MTSVTPFPHNPQAATRALLRAQKPESLQQLAREYSNISFAEVVAEMGYGNHCIRTQIEKLRALAEHAGFPLPKNPRIVNGIPLAGSANICKTSKWDRGSFLAWRDFYNAPAPGISASVLANTRANLSARAADVAGAAA